MQWAEVGDQPYHRAAARRPSLEDISGWIAGLGPPLREGVNRHSYPLR